MEPRDRLAQKLTAESEAYGYTLTIWGVGALLIHEYGTPSFPEILAYICGALVAFAVLAVVAFEAVFSEVAPEDSQQLVVTSMVHVLATAGNLVLSYLVVGAVAGAPVPSSAGFLLVSFQATFVYNVLLLIEDVAARVTAAIMPTAGE